MISFENVGQQLRLYFKQELNLISFVSAWDTCSTVMNHDVDGALSRRGLIVYLRPLEACCSHAARSAIASIQV